MLTVLFEEQVSASVAVEGMGWDLVKRSVEGSSRHRDPVSQRNLVCSGRAREKKNQEKNSFERIFEIT